jgi:putative sugar O-methyltransferase
LDHVSFSQGLAYLELIQDQDQDLLGTLGAISPLSTIGAPNRYSYKLGSIETKVSPTALRYLKVAHDLRILFGPLSNLTIGEIGIGFGGQAAVLSKLNPGASFVLWDLPPVLSLAGRFLANADVQANRDFFDGRDPSSHEVDLLVSNYAFSELRRTVQEMYLERVIQRCKRGYITWNRLSELELDGLTLEELLQRLPGAVVFDEVPLTAEGNCIVVWGHLPGAHPIGATAR